MTAIDQLAAFYGDPDEFTRDIHAHVLNGYCYITPDNLALARPICRSWTREDYSDPFRIAGLTEKADCWYVWAAIGDVDFLLSLIPYPLEWIAFARRKHSGHHRRAKFYKLTEFYGRRSTTRSPKGSASDLCQKRGDRGVQPGGEAA